jgi:hypothetical protein
MGFKALGEVSTPASPGGGFRPIELGREYNAPLPEDSHASLDLTNDEMDALPAQLTKQYGETARPSLKSEIESRLFDIAKGAVNLGSWIPRAAAAVPAAIATAPFIRPKSEITGQQTSLADAFRQALEAHTETGHLPYTGPADIPTGGEPVQIGALPEHAIGKLFEAGGEGIAKRTEQLREAGYLSPGAAAAFETAGNAAMFALGGRVGKREARTGREVSTVVRPQEAPAPPAPNPIEEWLAKKAQERAGPVQDVSEVGGVPPGQNLAPIEPARPTARPVEAPPFDYKPFPTLTPEERAIETRFGEQLKSNTDQAVEEYRNRFGNVINTDNARELSQDYQNDRTQSLAVHEPASAITKEVYRRALQEPVPEGKENDVVFTAGGSGAGKTSAVSKNEGLKSIVDKAQIVYDTNMNSYSSAKSKIDQALEAGKNVAIIYVHRDPMNALIGQPGMGGALSRAAKMAEKEGTGRTVPLTEFTKTHVGSRDVVQRIANEYGSNPKVSILSIDNKGPGRHELVPLTSFPKYTYNELHGRLQTALREEHAAGRVSDEIFHAVDRPVQGKGEAVRGDGRPEPARPFQEPEAALVGAEAPKRLAEDLPAQAEYLNREAKALGFPDADALLKAKPRDFNRLAEGWRNQHELTVGAKGRGVDKIRVSLQEPTGKIAKTLEAKFEPDAYLERYQRLLVRNEREAIGTAVRDVISAGMPEHFLEAMTGFTAALHGTDASYNVLNHTVAVKDILNVGDSNLRGYLAHEITHAVDHVPEKGMDPKWLISFISANSPRLGIEPGMGGRGLFLLGRGDISKEIISRWTAADNFQITSFFDYPLGRDFPEELMKLELFAQMSRLYITNPSLMQKELPIAYSAMKEIYDAAGTSLEETRNAIRTTLQTPGTVARAAGSVVRDRGQGELFQAAQRGARERSPGERVVGVEARPEHGGRPRDQAVDQTQTPEFKKWFGDSKVVDAEGKPLVVYHSTTEDFKSFDQEQLGAASRHPSAALGFFFSKSHEAADSFLSDFDQEHGGNIIPAYLSIKKPYAMAWPEFIRRFTSKTKSDSALIDETNAFKEKLADQGYDGVLIKRRVKSRSGTEMGEDNWVAFRPEQIKSAIGNKGTFDPNNPSIVGVQGPNPHWDIDQPGLIDNLTRQWQNNQIDLKKVQEAIERFGGVIKERGNAYLAEELYRDRVTARIKQAYKNGVEPILKDIKNANLTVDETGKYLWARHAPERNAQMAKINPGENDLSGLSNAEASKILASFSQAKREALDRIGERIDALTASTRQILVKNGLEEPSTIAAWEGAYKHYVPLFRDVDEAGTGRGFQVVGPESKRATGSHKEAQTVLAAVIAQHERAIVRAEKANVGRALIRLAEEFPNPDFWKVDQPPMKKTVNPTTGLVQTGVDPMYRQRDDVFIVKGKDPSGKVVERVLAFNPKNERAVALAHAMKNLDVVQLGAVTKAVGKVTRILANLATSWNPVFWTTNFVRDVQTAGVNLQSTPLRGRAPQVFANIPRALAGIMSAEFADGKGKWATAYRQFEMEGGKMEWASIFNDLVDRQEALASEIKASQRGNINPAKWGSLAMDVIEKTNSAIENGTRLATFVEGVDRGLSPKQSASLAKNLTVNFRRKGTQSTATGAWYMFFNANVQGTARMIAGLATSRRAQAIVGTMVAFGAALELVNRMIGDQNRDEEGNSPYELIPEDVRSKNMVFMLKGGKKASLPLAYGFSVFHNAGRMLMEQVLSAGGSKLVDEKKKPLDVAWNFAKVLIDSFMPLGNTTTPAQFVAPSVLDPAVQYAENKTWYGGPLRPEPQSFGPATPNHKLYFRETSDMAKDLTKWLSDLTGGDEVQGGSVDISPTTVTHILGSVTGGAGQFGLGVFDFTNHMVKRVAGEETSQDLPWKKVPFVGKFYGEVDDRDKAAKFYRLRSEAMDVWKKMETYRKSGDYDKASQVEEENPALAAMARELVTKSFKKEMKGFREEFKTVVDLPRSERQRERDRLKAEEVSTMSRAISAYNEAARESR